MIQVVVEEAVAVRVHPIARVIRGAWVGLGVFVIVAALSAAVVLSGFSAARDVSGELMERHEHVAVLAFIALLGVGGFSFAGLILGRRHAPPRGVVATVLVLGMLTIGLMAWTAYLGGMMRHTEVRPAPAAAEVAARGQ